MCYVPLKFCQYLRVCEQCWIRFLSIKEANIDKNAGLEYLLPVFPFLVYMIICFLFVSLESLIEAKIRSYRICKSNEDF